MLRAHPSELRVATDAANLEKPHYTAVATCFAKMRVGDIQFSTCTDAEDRSLPFRSATRRKPKPPKPVFLAHESEAWMYGWMEEGRGILTLLLLLAIGHAASDRRPASPSLPNG